MSPFSLSYVLGCTNPGRLVTSVNKFRTVVPSIFSIITALFPPSRTKMCMGSHAPCRKCQTTVRLTGHSRTVGSQNNCFRLPFWRLAFRDGSYIFGKFVNPSLCHMISQHTANRNAILRSWQRSTVLEDLQSQPPVHTVKYVENGKRTKRKCLSPTT